MNNNNIDLSGFNYNEFKADAIEKIKSGQPLTGKGGILTPLLIGIPHRIFRRYAF